MIRSALGRSMAHQTGELESRPLRADSIGGAGPAGEPSRAHPRRCTALSVRKHAIAPCALRLRSPGLVRDAG